jgi:hypothetical protein
LWDDYFDAIRESGSPAKNAHPAMYGFGQRATSRRFGNRPVVLEELECVGVDA